VQNGYLEWLVDELPQESWLNTHFWRWLIPQLYKKYPNMDMALNFACSEAPTVQLQTDGATVNAAAELTLLVKTDGQSLPVACISLVSSPSRNCKFLHTVVEAVLSLVSQVNLD
jgi:lipopolysaccharide-binding protein